MRRLGYPCSVALLREITFPPALLLYLHLPLMIVLGWGVLIAAIRQVINPKIFRFFNGYAKDFAEFVASVCVKMESRER